MNKYSSISLIVGLIGDSFSKISFSLDCFLERSFSEWLPLEYSRIIWVHFSGVMYLVIFGILYEGLIRLKVVRRKTYVWSNALIFFSLFTQFSILSILIAGSSCRSVSYKKHVKIFLDMDCWGKNHRTIFFSLLLPLICLQAIVFIR